MPRDIARLLEYKRDLDYVRREILEAQAEQKFLTVKLEVLGCRQGRILDLIAVEQEVQE